MKFFRRWLAAHAVGRRCRNSSLAKLTSPLSRLDIKEDDDGIWLVSFMHYDLGYFDLERKPYNPPRQLVRHEVVTYVLGTFCYLSVEAGHR